MPRSCKQIFSVFLFASPLLASSLAVADMPMMQACYQATDSALPKHSVPVETEEGEVVIFSREVDYQEEHHLSLEGDVEIVRGDVQVFSRQAQIDQDSQTAELLGDIKVRGPKLQVTGDAATLNMETKETKVSSAEFLSDITRIRGKAKRIHVPNQTQLNIEDGSFTTCQPHDEAWSFASKDIRLDQETGRGTATHTRFQIYDVPVLYLPWFTFAIDDRRASGFLYPEIGTANTGNGLFLSAPYYYNIAPHKDLTYTPSTIHGRGLHHELETRYLSRWGQTTLAAGYINKDDKFINEQEAKNKEDEGDRWGLSLEQGIAFESDFGQWIGHVDYSAVSDDDYLDDLNQGLQIENQDYLDRRAELALSYDTWHLKALVQQYAILDDDALPNERPFQRLPELSFQLNQHLSAFHLNWHSDYVYFYRDDQDLALDDQAYGSRLHHRPRLSLPLQKTWGYLTPTVSIDHTDYWLQSYGPADNHLERTVAIGEIDSGLFLDRYSQWGKNTIRHSLEPRAYYVDSDFLQSSAEAQSSFPNFDSALPNFYFDRLFTSERFLGGDRIGEEKRYTLGFTSRWSDLNSGRDWASISFAYVHHLADNVVTLEGADSIRKDDKQYAAELELSPTKTFDIHASALWDEQREEMLETYSKLSFHSEDFGHVFNVAHRYRDGDDGEGGIEQADSSLITPLWSQTSLLARWRYELNSHRTIGSLLGFEYRSCCWRVQILGQRYLTDESDIENGVLFRFQLIGLGSYGGSTSALDDQIPGYAAREEYYR